MKNNSIGIIISTYNNPEWLKKALWGYTCQTIMPDEILIADDGSGEETRIIIESFKDRLPVKHIWHPDEGFRKCRILNTAIIKAESDYLIFTDQDCIPRKDFIATHIRHSKKGRFLSGGYFRLPMNISLKLKEEDILSQNAFSLRWLMNESLSPTFKATKLFKNRRFSWFMNKITPAKSTWNGCNSSGWKSDMIAVNGFNEKMQYGGEDCEFGDRLRNLGIRPKQIRFSATILHLDHDRPYKTAEAIAFNKDIRKETRKNMIIETPYGIKQHLTDDSQ